MITDLEIRQCIASWYKNHTEDPKDYTMLIPSCEIDDIIEKYGKYYTNFNETHKLYGFKYIACDKYKELRIVPDHIINQNV